MQVVESIEVGRGKRIDLAYGDVLRMSRREWVDALVVSAFRGDYTPTQHSLIGALDRHGVSVQHLAERKDVDYTEDHGAWLSRPFTSTDPGVGFDRILCFEPERIGSPPETVGELFRALVPMLHARPSIRAIATPILASGDQGYSTTEMLQPLLDAAIEWLKLGLPLDRVVVVSHSDRAIDEARALFRSLSKPQLREVAVGVAQPSPSRPAGDQAYDVFISYARKNAAHRARIVDQIAVAKKELRVFVDETDIPIGAGWQGQVFPNIERSKVFVALLSPDYVVSANCSDEYNAAHTLANERPQSFRIIPLFLSDVRLPVLMRLRNFLDCREFDESRYPEAAAHVVAAVGRPSS